jgi:adenylate kinase
MIILFGPAGSGKSLQGQIIAQKYGWQWISAGQLLRDQHDPKLDAQFKNGELFDDELVTKLMHNAITKAAKKGQEIILDGYPRNIWQTEWFIKQGDAAKTNGAIALEVPQKELLKRIKLRARPTENVKDKDAIRPIKRRWEIFEQNIYSILPLLEKENVKITTLNGVGGVDEITAKIEAVLADWGLVTPEEIALSSDDYDTERSYGE